MAKKPCPKREGTWARSWVCARRKGHDGNCSPTCPWNVKQVGGVMLAVLLLLPALACAQVPNLRKNLVAYWRMEEASNGPRLDWSGNGHTLTDNAGNVAATTGKIGNGAAFSTTTGMYLKTADGTGFPHGDQDITIAAWVWLNSGNTGTYDMVAKTSPVPNAGWNMRYNAGTGRLAWTVSTTGSNALTCAEFDGATISADAWHLYVAEFRASDNLLFVYIDGSLRGSCAAGDMFNNTANITIGGAGNAGTPRMWPGRADGVAIWSRVLSAADVTALWNGGAGMVITHPTLFLGAN